MVVKQTLNRTGDKSGDQVLSAYFGRGSVRDKITRPTTAAISDPTRMPILDSSATDGSSKANREMNSDTVKPMPATMANPTM